MAARVARASAVDSLVACRTWAAVVAAGAAVAAAAVVVVIAAVAVAVVVAEGRCRSSYGACRRRMTAAGGRYVVFPAS